MIEDRFAPLEAAAGDAGDEPEDVHRTASPSVALGTGTTTTTGRARDETRRLRRLFPPCQEPVEDRGLGDADAAWHSAWQDVAQAGVEAAPRGVENRRGASKDLQQTLPAIRARRQRDDTTT